MAYFSHKYLTTLGGKSLVVGVMPLASRKARSVLSQRRKVSGQTPAARASSIFVCDFIFYNSCLFERQLLSMQKTALVSKTKNEMMVSENRIRIAFGIPSVSLRDIEGIRLHLLIHAIKHKSIERELFAVGG